MRLFRLRQLETKPTSNVDDLRTAGVTYNDNPKIDRLIFICGLHLSGTTPLEHYIHANFNVSCLRGEVSENEGQHLQNVYSAAQRFGGPGRFAFSEAMRQELQELSDRKACREKILHSWRKYVVGEESTLLEKSPPNLTKITWLRSTFPGSRFIIMTRDPRAVATATRKWSNNTLEELMMHWQVAHSIAHSEFDADDTCTIRYEDFCKDPVGTITNSAIEKWITRRPQPLSIEARFENLSDRNEAYTAAHHAPSYGPGIWDKFGYVL